MTVKNAIVFPGQGSQFLGMMGDVSGAQKIFDHASEVLGFDLWKLTQEGPEEDLNKTINTQPALLAAGVAAWQLCKNNNPTFLAGHF